ncbi:MAG TPA: hypothetical protein VNX68_00985 [Nitrosopumilaceae archaeon]|jgi:hypothetical protein|nr:hypothetical protein [Nitrosopumilaceae archaeon]
MLHIAGGIILAYILIVDVMPFLGKVVIGTLEAMNTPQPTKIKQPDTKKYKKVLPWNCLLNRVWEVK